MKLPNASAKYVHIIHFGGKKNSLELSNKSE